MKIKYFGLLSFLFLVWGCSPKNDEATAEHVAPSRSEEVTDSAANTRRDMVAREGTEDLGPLPVPQPVIELLGQHYPDWKQPVLLAEAKQKADNFDQGPLSIRGDFNGDNEQDYAMQIQQEDEVIILAFIRNEENWQVQELMKDIMFNDRGTAKSLYYLSLTEAGSEVYNQQTKERLQLQQDAVTVGIDTNLTTFVLENGRFRSFPTTI